MPLGQSVLSRLASHCPVSLARPLFFCSSSGRVQGCRLYEALVDDPRVTVSLQPAVDQQLATSPPALTSVCVSWVGDDGPLQVAW